MDDRAENGDADTPSSQDDSPPLDDAEATAVLDPVTPTPAIARRQDVLSAAIAGSAAVLLGVGTWFGLGALFGDSSGVDITVPGLDRVLGDWEVDWTGTYEPDLPPYSPDYLNAPASFDDGLDHSSLPPLVERPSPRYPQAHELTPAIWDHVGAGWYIASYDYGASYPWGGLSATPVLYLVSTEGVHFELPPLPGYPSARIDYVNLDERWASVSTSVPESGAGWNWLKWDLVTGEVYEECSGSDGPIYYGECFDVYGPFAGGGELHVWTSVEFEDESSPEWDRTISSRRLAFWDPDEGEIPLSLPSDSGFARGNNNFTIQLSSDSSFAIVGIDSYDYESGAQSGRAWQFDPQTHTLTEIDLGISATSIWAVDVDSVIQSDWDNTTQSIYYTRFPLNGDPSEPISLQEALSIRWVGSEIVATPSDDGYGWVRLVDSATTPVRVLYPNETLLPGSIGCELTRTDIGGDRIVLSGFHEHERGWSSVVMGYDRTTGETFLLIPSIIRDTGWRSGFGSAYIIPAIPEAPEARPEPEPSPSPSSPSPSPSGPGSSPTPTPEVTPSASTAASGGE